MSPSPPASDPRAPAAGASHHSGGHITSHALFLKHTPAAVAMFDRNMCYILCSDRWLTDYGLGDQSVLGRSHYDVFPDAPEHWRDLHRRCLAGEVLADERSRYPREDGSVVWLKWEIRPWRGNDGEIGGIVMFTEVITSMVEAEERLRASEEHFRTLAECVRDYAVFMLDPAGRISTWNSGAKAATGYGESEIAGRHFSLFHPPEDTEEGRLEKRLRHAAAAGRWEGEDWLVRKDGSRYLATEVVTALHDSAGAVRGFSIVTRDVTERRQIERERQRSQRLQSLGTMAGGIAHDLNNALGPVLLALEMLRGGRPEDAELLDTLEGGARRAADIVRQLLTFAAGADVDLNSHVDAAEAVREVEKILQSGFPKNIRTRVRPPSEPLGIRADATQIQQVLLNLCVNARDAMPRGGSLFLDVESAEIDETFAGGMADARPGPHVLFRVRDTGEGIPPARMERIFEPFFTTKSPDKGTGLGLSSVLGIVRAHGGFVRVQSQPGVGTEFFVFLPAAAGVAPTTPVDAPPEVRGNGETVLFVDDEPAVREVAETVLRRLNFNVITAVDGVDALIQTATRAADLRLIITDLQMPELDGVGFLRAARRMLPDVPVIVASGRMEAARAEELHEMGVSARLDKPFTQAMLTAAIRQALPVS